MCRSATPSSPLLLSTQKYGPDFLLDRLWFRTGLRNLLSYDLNGSPLGDGSFSYAWDAESRMKIAAGVNYTYDGDDRRVAKLGRFLLSQAEQGQLRVNQQAAGPHRRDKLERGLLAIGDDGAEQHGLAAGPRRVERHGRKETFRHAALLQRAADEEPSALRPDSEFDRIARDAGRTHPLVEEPVHRTAALERHGRGHELFDLALQVRGGYRGVAVSIEQRAQELGKARVGRFGRGLAKHDAKHVEHPGALAVNHPLEGLGRPR